MKKLLYILPCLLCLFACEPKLTVEEEATRMLNNAREQLQRGNALAAKDTILSMRLKFPTAIEVRKEAILTMDSIELALAQGDSLKTLFFIRKIEHDQQKLNATNK